MKKVYLHIKNPGYKWDKEDEQLLNKGDNIIYVEIRSPYKVK